MIKHNEIKKLIKDGFDLDLLSFEFDIPINQLIKYKKELETTKGTSSLSKIEQMRQKYEKLLKVNNDDEIKQEDTQSSEEYELIEQVILELKQKLEQMDSMIELKDKRNCADEMTVSFNKIQECQMSIEQIEELKLLIEDNKLDDLKLSIRSNLYRQIINCREKMLKKLIEWINNKASKTNDIEGIKSLQKKIKISTQQNYPFEVESVIIKLQNKKNKLQTQQAVYNLKNNIPIEIVNVIKDISAGVVKIEEANEIIRQESEKRQESKSKTKFSLTLEQEQKQLATQIMSQLSECGDKYPIVYPEKALSDLQGITGVTLVQSLNTVVHNLIARKEFEQAKKICSQNSTEEYRDAITQYCRSLKNKIKIAEISDMVLKGINKKGTVEQENRYFETIQQGILDSNINLSTISLGKSVDGIKDITLADVWPESEEVIR